MTRRQFASIALAPALALLLRPGAGLAAPMVPYSREAFAQAQGAGKPIVVFVHAGWCITCRRQQPVLEELGKDAAFAGVTVFVVDYADKTALRELDVADRSTLVAYKGASERKRLSFETDPAKIRALFESAL